MPPLTVYWALVRAGFRRYSTYRQATVAGATTNVMFGFLRTYGMFAAAAAAGGVLAGYDRPRLATFVWVSQGMLATINIWGPPEYAERVRTGDAVTDLLRPVHPVWQLLAVDLGRAGFALLTRFVAPVVVGALAFGLYAPARWSTYPAFALSLVLALLVTFGCRHALFCSVHWLLDVRGPMTAWVLFSTLLSGMVFPLWILPEPLPALVVYGMPFASMVQAPMDVLVERGDPLRLLLTQAAWAAVALPAAVLIQRRGERKMVIQGG
ncbi:ABC transporter permease [Virgisporangium aliadipatigenens]|uniref:ABC transporter permease n=1 Tax=Virgisporangium aliadipatigenens TaxID=741659 RepID=A0A8J4DUW2_9ACTN|nr:ABC-2 family transporter protein [Virgisporangium aliadipatigenens]GIJ50503.1 ABC transporter permease [Virgisporangium aliadipatigenens]